MLVANFDPPPGTGPLVYIVGLGGGAGRPALSLTLSLRRAGIGADLDLAGRSMKGQMKDASRSGARWAAILGDEEVEGNFVTLKDLGEGTQEQVPLGDLERRLKT